VEFGQPDSIISDQYNPQTLNRNAYVDSNPINNSDPTGHLGCLLELPEISSSPVNSPEEMFTIVDAFGATILDSAQVVMVQELRTDLTRLFQPELVHDR